MPDRKPYFFARFLFWMAGCLKSFIHALGHGYRISSAMTLKEVSPVFRLQMRIMGFSGRHYKVGYGKVTTLSDKILEKLKEQDGFISVTDKSSPEVIYEMFGASKKTYKKAIGGLYKERKITLEKDGVRLKM